MLVNAGFMSGAGVKAIVPALIANTVWVGGEFGRSFLLLFFLLVVVVVLGSLFLTSPWWAKTALYTTSLGFGVVPLIWYIGCRLRDISKSHGDRELAGRWVSVTRHEIQMVVVGEQVPSDSRLDGGDTIAVPSGVAAH